MIDDFSPPGSYRAALAPNAYCAGCRQSVCDCPDPIYAGIVPPLNGRRQHDAGALDARVSSFHNERGSRGSQ